MLKNLLVVLALLFVSSTLFAEATDKWKISLGGMFVANFETDMQMSKKGFPLGAKINTEDQLGLDSETSVFRLDGYYRFNNYHSVDFSYFSVKSDGDRFVEDTFEWNGDTLSNVAVRSHFDMDIYKINYAYSFYHNDDIELALTAGFHITGIDLGISAEGTVNEEEESKTSSGASVTVPLPVVGFKGEYTIIKDTLYASYRAEYFYLKFEDYKGSFISTMFNVEYRFLENYGVGVGFNNNVFYAEVDDSNKRIEVENTLSGAMAYVSYTY